MLMEGVGAQVLEEVVVVVVAVGLQEQAELMRPNCDWQPGAMALLGNPVVWVLMVVV